MSALDRLSLQKKIPLPLLSDVVGRLCDINSVVNAKIMIIAKKLNIFMEEYN